MENVQAQAAFIHKAAKALKTGGHISLDFDLHFDPTSIFSGIREDSYFSGTDDMGTSGHTVRYGSVYDPVTQVCAGADHWELITNCGEQIIISKRWYKHIPTQAQVYRWLEEAGLVIERTYMNFTEEPLPIPIVESTYRATVWARKK